MYVISTSLGSFSLRVHKHHHDVLFRWIRDWVVSMCVAISVGGYWLNWQFTISIHLNSRWNIFLTTSFFKRPIIFYNPMFWKSLWTLIMCKWIISTMKKFMEISNFYRNTIIFHLQVWQSFQKFWIRLARRIQFCQISFAIFKFNISTWLFLWPIHRYHFVSV